MNHPINVSGNQIARESADKFIRYTEIIKRNEDGTRQIKYLNHEKLWHFAHLLQETDPARLEELKECAKYQHPDCEYDLTTTLTE